MSLFRRGIAILIATIGLGIAQSAHSSKVLAEDGDLNTIRADVRTPPSPPPASSGSSSTGTVAGTANRPYDPNREAQENAVGMLGGGILYGAGYVVTAPLWAPMNMLEDSLDKVWCYPQFPYEQTRGYLFNLEAAEAYHAKLRDPNLDRKDLIPDQSDIYPNEIIPRRYAIRAAAEYGDSFNRLHYTGGSLFLSSSMRLGLETTWRYYEERPAAGRIDALNLGNADITFQIAQSERAIFRFGLGTNWLADRQEANFGFNFHYAVDFFPRKPWVFSGEFDAGTLGNTHLIHARTTAGVLWRRTEGFAGFDYLDIGRVNSGSLIGGVRFWF
jgi:hypothetical protein